MAMRLYWVEDNPLIVENLQGALRDIPQTQWVGHCGDEGQAVQWLSKNAHAWDAVVVDLFLQAGTGLGVLARIAKSYPMKQILVLSNYVGHEIRQQCLRLGAAAVFDKTQEIDRFLAFIAEQAQAPSLAAGSIE